MSETIHIVEDPNGAPVELVYPEALPPLEEEHKGYVLLLMEEYEQSEKVFDFFLARYENKTDEFFKYALYLLAKNNYELKNYDKALLSVDQAIDVDENFKEALDLKKTIKSKMEKK